MDRSLLIGATVTGAACVIAVARSLSAAAPSDLAAADLATRQAMFAAVASDEARLRRDSAKKFPTDLWSQDDDFHQSELKRARSVAAQHGVRLCDALSAIDEGMREGWAPAPGTVIRSTVPPCQPRAIY